MAPSPESSAPATALSREDRIRLYRTIYAARRIDDKEILGKRQNKVFFQINGVGHEAVQAAAALVFRPGRDWFFFYYRDRALAYGLGYTAKEMFLGSVGAGADPASGGRQMPSHWGHQALNIFTTSSPTGSQLLQAVGAAEALLRAEQGDLLGPMDMQADEVVLTSTGDGTCSQGEFWEAMSNAVNLKAPIVFLVEDNGFAISTPTEVQYAGGNVAALLQGYAAQGLLIIDEVDGCDPLASHAALLKAAAYARARLGPALVRARVIRPYSHSLSDDEQAYKSKTLREAEALRDPVTTYARQLVAWGDLTEEGLAALKDEVQAEINAAWEAAEAAPGPASGSYFQHLYSEVVDPTAPAFDTEFAPGDQATGTKTMLDLINATLKHEMARDSKILLFGEDVADVSHDDNAEELKGKGGVFKATHGLQKRFGDHRVFNTPLAEATIVGRAIGLAVRGSPHQRRLAAPDPARQILRRLGRGQRGVFPRSCRPGRRPGSGHAQDGGAGDRKTGGRQRSRLPRGPQHHRIDLHLVLAAGRLRHEVEHPRQRQIAQHEGDRRRLFVRIQQNDIHALGRTAGVEFLGGRAQRRHHLAQGHPGEADRRQHDVAQLARHR